MLTAPQLSSTGQPLWRWPKPGHSLTYGLIARRGGRWIWGSSVLVNETRIVLTYKSCLLPQNGRNMRDVTFEYPQPTCTPQE